MIVTCQICGNNFEADRRNAKNCSDECRKEYRRQRMQKLREADPEFYQQQYKAWYEQGGVEYHKQWRDKHPEYREQNNERSAKRQKEIPGLKKHYNATYYQRHKEQVRAGVDAWREANPENARQVRQRSVIHYRARLAKAEGKWTTKQFRALCEASDWHCWYCHIPTDKLTADHMQPVSRGGSNDISNIAPACLPCNTSKRDKTPLEFLQYLKRSK